MDATMKVFDIVSDLKDPNFLNMLKPKTGFFGAALTGGGSLADIANTKGPDPGDPQNNKEEVESASNSTCPSPLTGCEGSEFEMNSIKYRCGSGGGRDPDVCYQLPSECQPPN